MQASPLSILIVVVFGVLSFALGRWLSRGWRARRQATTEAARRATETRQQRRWRERHENRRKT
jgi:hypothetical protein